MNDRTVKRRLTAIVVADVVGYSRLMGEDEAGALRRLTRYRAELIDPLVQDHRGRIVNAVGDSLLLEFGSVVDATRCAVALQQELERRNGAIEARQRICFRMGVNIGDVIVQDRSLFGDGVNVAARLQTLADPGGICLSSAAFEQIRGKIDADFAHRGAHRVKNIDRPIEVYALSAQGIGLVARGPSSPRRNNLRRASLLAVACGLLVGLAFGGYSYRRHAVRADFTAGLDRLLSAMQAKLTDSARAQLVADYLSLPEHRAFAIAPKAQAHWYTGDWPGAKTAEDKLLERCQMAFGEPCELAAVDEALAPQSGEDAHAGREMAKVAYAQAFDPEQIPGVRSIVATRADVVGYVKAAEPKAAAIHPRGLVTIVTGAASQRKAELRALKLCNDDDDAKQGDGLCYLYAVGDKVVLPQRSTVPLTAKP